jgi:hypothetical protein
MSIELEVVNNANAIITSTVQRKVSVRALFGEVSRGNSLAPTPLSVPQRIRRIK